MHKELGSKQDLPFCSVSMLLPLAFENSITDQGDRSMYLNRTCSGSSSWQDQSTNFYTITLTVVNLEFLYTFTHWQVQHSRTCQALSVHSDLYPSSSSASALVKKSSCESTRPQKGQIRNSMSCLKTVWSSRRPWIHLSIQAWLFPLSKSSIGSLK